MSFPRIVSPIAKIHWAGWETDTYRLQENGWDISVKEDLCTDSIRLCIRHPEYKIYGLSNMIPYMEVTYNRSQEIHFSIVNMCSKLEVRIYDDLSGFKPIDATPNFVNDEYKSIEDYKIFKTISKKNEIYVAKKTVPELMQLILEKQAPKQKEIRKKIRKMQEEKGFQQFQNTEAQIISLDFAA